jgi:hypothetical protein
MNGKKSYLFPEIVFVITFRFMNVAISSSRSRSHKYLRQKIQK